MQINQTSFNKDYAKNRTVFTEEYERQRALLLREIQKNITPRGWANRIFHAIVGKPFYSNWN